MSGQHVGPEPARSLKRSADQKVLAGVCGGLGEHFGINAWWFRWAFIILVFVGFAGIALYFLAWLLIPRADGDSSIIGGWLDDLDLTDIGTLLGVVLLGAAALIVAMSVFRISGAIVIAVVLGVVGLLLYRGDLRPPEKPQSGAPHYIDEDEPSPGAEPTSHAADDQTPADTPSAGVPVAAAVATRPRKTPKPPKVKKPKPPPSMLGRLTMAVVLIVVSTMVILDLSGWGRFQPVEYLAAGMGIIALGLLVGAWVGRAYWLIVIGLLVAPLLFVSALLPKIADWSVGAPLYEPASVEQIQDSYSLGLGELTIDLSRLTPDQLAEVGTVEASLSAGELFVILPHGAGTVVHAEVGAGSVTTVVQFYEVHGVRPEAIFDTFEDCLAGGFGLDECGMKFLDGDSFYDNELAYSEYGWDEWHFDSGIGVTKSFDLGAPPRDFVLELKVGAGRIQIIQIGKFHAVDRHRG